MLNISYQFVGSLNILNVIFLLKAEAIEPVLDIYVVEAVPLQKSASS